MSITTTITTLSTPYSLIDNPISLQIRRAELSKAFKAFKAAVNNQSKTTLNPSTILKLKKAIQSPGSAKRKWEKLIKASDCLKEDYYVFAHSSTSSLRFLVDMQTYLDPGHQKPFHNSNWTTQRRLRPLLHLKAPLFKNTSEYVESDFYKKINSPTGTDHYPNSEHMISCDANLRNNCAFESAFHFFENKSSFFAQSGYLPKFYPQYFNNWRICYLALQASQFVLDASPSACSSQPKHQIGRVYLLAIPKITFENPSTTYAWNSHSFGKYCRCLHLPDKFNHPRFLSNLKKDQLNEVSSCLFYKMGAQYRILTGSLDHDSLKHIIALDPFSDKDPLEKTYKKRFWGLAHLLKQFQSLESITPDTPIEDLLTILARTSFSFSHYHLELPELSQIYEDALEEVFAKKATIIAWHFDSIQNELSERFFTGLKTLELLDVIEDLHKTIPRTSKAEFFQRAKVKLNQLYLTVQNASKDSFIHVIRSNQIFAKNTDFTLCLPKEFFQDPKVSASLFNQFDLFHKRSFFQTYANYVDIEWLKTLLKENPDYFEFFPDACRDLDAIAQVAISKRWRNLKHASDRLKKDPKTVLLAMSIAKSNQPLIRYSSLKMLSNPEFFKKAVAIDPTTKNFVMPKRQRLRQIFKKNKFHRKLGSVS